jgi:hypothetical protein
MNSDDVVAQVEADEQILTFDIPDDVLERTANAEQRAFTMMYCTSTTLADFYSSCMFAPIHFRQCGHRCGGSRAMSATMA